MPTREDELIALTRTIESLRTKKRRLNRQLKAVKQDLAAETKHRRALLQHIEMERAPDVFPSKLTSGATGLKVPKRTDDQAAERAEARMCRMEDL